MDPNRKERTLAQLEAVEKETRAFICPVREARLQFRVRVDVVGVQLTERSEEIIAQRNGVLREPLHPVIREARAMGIYEAFQKTVEACEGASRPKDPQRYFLTWLQRIERIKSPQYAIKLCLPQDDREGDAELYTFGPISVVLLDGCFKMFLPTVLVKGEYLQNLALKNSTLQAERRLDLGGWIRTRNGYVANRGALFSELKGKAFGDFDNINLAGR